MFKGHGQDIFCIKVLVVSDFETLFPAGDALCILGEPGKVAP